MHSIFPRNSFSGVLVPRQEVTNRMPLDVGFLTCQLGQTQRTPSSESKMAGKDIDFFVTSTQYCLNVAHRLFAMIVSCVKMCWLSTGAAKIG